MNDAWPMVLSVVMIVVACTIVMPVSRRVDGVDVGILLFAGVVIGVSLARIEVTVRGRRLRRRNTRIP